MSGIRDIGFEEALAALSSLINQRKRADGSNWGDAFALMYKYVEVLGLEEKLNELSIIHVAGTKGKGSTCAMVESILRASGHSTGLFTSPHLVDVRERFKLNGQMVSVDSFTESFWHCYNKFRAASSGSLPMPAYFRFLTLLAFHIFVEAKVDVVVLEVGLGGRYDATNVVAHPAVCGISMLGFDHMEILGDTLALIAGEKAGILKPGVPAITASQEDEAMQVLQARADELQIPLTLAPSLDDITTGVRVGLAGRYQKVNASLAVALCRKWAERSGRKEEAASVTQALEQRTLPPAYLKGLLTAEWPGRCQKISDIRANLSRGEGELTLFLDGAHTVESMDVCGEWYSEEVEEGEGERRVEEDGLKPFRVLLFNCMPERDPSALLPRLLSACSQKGVTFHRALFVPPLSSYTNLLTPSGGASSPVKIQSAHATDRRANVDEGEEKVMVQEEMGADRQHIPLPGDSLTAVRKSYPALQWQHSIQRTWDEMQARAGDSSNHEYHLGRIHPSYLLSGITNGARVEGSLIEHIPRGRPQSLNDTPEQAEWTNRTCIIGNTSAVLPTLPMALQFLRDCARHNRQAKLQVLVTGSLHLVGDVLRLLRK